MTTYYIKNGGNDAADGLSDGNAWENISKITSGSFNAGDSILLNKGDSWSGTITIPGQGASGNNITIGAYGSGAKPIIDGGANAPAITVTAADRGYWTIDGLDLRSSGIVVGTRSLSIYFNYWPDDMGEVPEWTIKNCTFDAGIHVSGPNILIQDNVFDGTGNATALFGAIEIRGVNGSGATVEGNTVSNFVDRGIWVYRSADNCIVRNNVVHDITSGASNEGAGINFDGFDTVMTGEVCYGNTIYDCGYGITHENCFSQNTYNNLIHDCDTFGADFISYGGNRDLALNSKFDYNIIYNQNNGFRVYDSKNISFRNNVFYGDVGATTSAFKVMTSTTYTSNLTFVNNIIDGGWDYPLNVPDNAAIWTELDYNDIVPAGTLVMIQIVGGNKTLADLQGMGHMANGFTDDPAFVNAAGDDFHLQSGSPCIETGADVGLLLDYEGKPLGRGTNPDIGAFETLKGGPRKL